MKYRPPWATRGRSIVDVWPSIAFDLCKTAKALSLSFLLPRSAVVLLNNARSSASDEPIAPANQGCMCISCIIKVSFVSKDRRCAFRRSWPSEPSEAGADSSQPTARPAGHGVLQQAVRPGSSPAPRWSDATPPATVITVCNSMERWRAPPQVGIADRLLQQHQTIRLTLEIGTI